MYIFKEIKKKAPPPPTFVGHKEEEVNQEVYLLAAFDYGMRRRLVALSSKVLSFLFITFLAAFSDNCKIFNTSNKDQKATKKLFVTVCCDCR